MNVILPETLDAALAALADPGARVFAGGTDMLVRERLERAAGRAFSGTWVGLERIADLRGVSRDGESLRIGAATTFADLETSALVREHARVLSLAAAEVGGPAIRHMGTLGGNIMTASPAGDSLPALSVLNAEVELVSTAGTRRLPLSEFIVGPRRTAALPGEILTAVHVPSAASLGIHHFEKVGRRDALSIAVVSLAALLRLDERGRVEEARLAWGSVTPVVRRSPEAEAALIGRKLTPATLARVGAIARRTVSPVDDIRASAAYRREVAGNLPARLAVDQRGENE